MIVIQDLEKQETLHISAALTYASYENSKDLILNFEVE
jgi:hypothetical protein